MSGKGADVTAAATYLVEVSARGSSYTIDRAAILGGFEHQPTQSASDGALSGLAESARDLPSNLRKGDLFANLPSHEVMLRVTEVASTTPAALASLARMEVHEATGKDDGFITGMQLFSNDFAKSQQMLIAMAREPMLEHFTTALQYARLRVDALVPATVALYHCHLVSGDLETQGVQMIANIGEISTDFIVVQGGDLLAARTVNYGLADFVAAIATGLGINKEQARQVALSTMNIRPGHQSENPSGEGVVRHGQDAAARLASHLRAAEGYVKAVTGRFNLKIDMLALCGPGALIGGLPEFLAHRAQREVTIFNPISGFDFGTLGGNQRAMIGQHAVAMAISLGLAKISCDRGRGAAILLPPSVIARNNFLQRSVWLYAAVLVLVVTLGLGLFLSTNAVDASKEVKRILDTERADYDRAHQRVKAGTKSFGDTGISNAQAEFEAKSELQRDLIVQEQQLSETLALSAGTNRARHIMTALPAMMSEGMSLETFEVAYETRDGMTSPFVRFSVKVVNQSASNTALVALKDKLKGHPMVASVTNDVGKGSTDLTAETASFSVRLKNPRADVIGEKPVDDTSGGGA